MDIELEIISILKKRSHSEFAGVEVHHLEHVQELAYRLHHKNRSYFIKWIPPDDQYGLNEIQVNREIAAKANSPVPRLLFVSQTERASLACWEWLEGVDLRHQHRHLLPDAFARLGEFHSAQRHDQFVYSPTTHQAFASIREMLKDEVDFLCSAYDGSAKSQCGSILSLLEVGYPTLIHGDMHPGNIYFTEAGLKFVDWGYSIRSLNLFDLDYVQSLSLNTPVNTSELSWWVITPSESEPVLRAYFNTCGLGGLDYKQTHLAVMLWGELRACHNSLANNDQAGAAVCHQNIERLIRTTY